MRWTPITEILRDAKRRNSTEGEEAAQWNMLPIQDLMIAVAAIELGYAVPTVNLRHFQRIPGLLVASL